MSAELGDKRLNKSMFTTSVGDYILHCEVDGLPQLYGEYIKHAILVTEIDIQKSSGQNCFVAVQKNDAPWPFLVVAQRYSPAGYGFYPGVCFVPETKLLFIGAGQRLLAYQLDPLKQLWEDMTDCGFWRWAKHDKYILMSAELELAAWNIHGQKLWSTFVEPPWNYQITDDMIKVEVMGIYAEFSLMSGPNDNGDKTFF